MILRSHRIGCLALIAAACLHAGGLVQWDITDDIEIAGGSASSVQASLGDSFADLAAGTLTPIEATETLDTVKPPDEISPVPVGRETRQPPVDTRVDPVDVEAETSAPRAPNQVQRPTEAQAVPTPVPETARSPRPTVPVLRAATPSAQPQVQAALPPALPARPRQTVSPSVPTDTLTAKDPAAEEDTAVARPQLRPASIAAQAREDRLREAERRRQTASAPAGNQAVTNARTGQADGRETAPQARNTAGQTARADAGNAAVSNYPGQVARKIRGVRHPRIGTRGTAVIAFRVADNGGLGTVSVAQSSGSARLDQAAVQVIQRAAPFPAPPSGAQRQFQIRITGR
ncbi:TonB family protein [uncultured Roseobacter sp.]|uniref:TonB family protein n=1 Tax=uncultured Roseobacter sp. TaxID=114847 RepID=UPI0026072BA9|nr:TonB family protein [uncultured Roseobacter sp.]